MTWWFFQKKPVKPSLAQWQGRWVCENGSERRWAIATRYFRGVDVEEWFNISVECAVLMVNMGMPVRLVELQR